MELFLSSAAGSELPWWSPLGVSLLLVVVSLVYRWREHRNDPPETMNGEVLSGDQNGGTGEHAPGPFPNDCPALIQHP